MQPAEIIANLCRQFAFRRDDPAGISTGGMSALEDAFAYLGWTNPHPLPEDECQVDGCHAFADCGTPTEDGGYKRVCGKHFTEINAGGKRDE